MLFCRRKRSETQNRPCQGEGIRFALTTFAILLVMAAASALGLPDAALGALLPVAVIVLAGRFYRGRLPGPAQITDLIIPR